MVASDFGEPPPWNETLGPVRPRGGPNGLVLRSGHDRRRVGRHDARRHDLQRRQELSVDPGRARLGPRPDRRPARAGVPHPVDDGGFDPPHNDAITWHHLLQQTSEWEGELWDKPDLIDRNRSVGGRPAHRRKGHATATCRRRASSGNTTTSGSTACASRCCASGAGRCRRCSASWSWSRSAPRRLGMARLPQFLCRDRRQADAVGLGRRALGRRRVHPCPRPGADRPDAAARRRLGRPAHPVGSLDRADARALPALSAIRLSVVAQHRPRAVIRAPRRAAISPAAPAAI